MELSIGKWYRTRNGHKVIIYALNGMDPFPVHGAILTEDGWAIKTWNRDGYDWNISESPKDIVGVWVEPDHPKPITQGTYLTRDGRKAAVYFVADRGSYPIYGAIFGDSGNGITVMWDRQGKSGENANRDLMTRL